MSWMDSWSRPRKDQAVPAPFYLTNPETKYCHTCGRVIGQRRVNATKTGQAVVKYCSDKCKQRKPRSAGGSLETRIEHALIELLEGGSVHPPARDGEDEAPPVRAKSQPKKGDPRIIVQLSEIEEAVFGKRQDPEKTFGRRRNRARRGVPDGPEWRSVDMVEDEAANEITAPDVIPSSDDDDTPNPRANDTTHKSEIFETAGTSLPIRLPQDQSDVNFSVGGERGWAEKIEETPEMQHKRLEGVKRAEEKELVKQVARRAVVFGLSLPLKATNAQITSKGKKSKSHRSQHEQDDVNMDLALKKCEALMNGSVVEPSFAKGDWSIRWREE